ncbi:tweedleV [Glossina fuscipes fuscipes]
MEAIVVLCLIAIVSATFDNYNDNNRKDELERSDGSSLNNNWHINGVLGAQNFANRHYGFNRQYPQLQQPSTVITKQFFVHAAPEDADEGYQEKHVTLGPARKHYNIVFIKSPSVSNRKTALKISPASHEEKTIIYVLNKKAEAAEIHAEILEKPTTTTKPQVVFIKYKTDEEAANAQEYIKTKFEALGDSHAQVDDERTASIDSLDHSSHISDGIGGASTTGIGRAVSSDSHGSVHNEYLPPILSIR